MNVARTTWHSRRISVSTRLLLPLVLAVLNSAANVRGADPFAENIRSTPAQTPEQERASFRVPSGFDIQLFAAEPQILKPMNMAFDAKGRLWVTVTREYPHPVPPGKYGRDEIRILEDTDGDGRGRADKVTTFIDGLNIPIGHFPYQDGVIAWSIPNLWCFQDTDGDGKADKREVLYGPLGWDRDTHGRNSSFVRGYDGWLYATHGFNNNTTVRGRDGREISMNSGNTYRFRPDGSRIEQNTWGQVNPFGLVLDSLGNLYAADCHSEPVYQLLRGGYYPSFGKPDDGLGFAPSMIFHQHGSTAISGIVFYEGDEWPEEYRNNVFTGNVMTSRVNRDAVSFSGSTPKANHKLDFISTDDPWFRPVNLQLGPDGALYIADFYNRIIGHYEVPLDHPGRDRTSGRIWRLVYKGDNAKPKTQNPSLPDDLNGLISEIGSPNLTRRMLAMNQLTDRIGQAAVTPVKKLFRDKQSSAFQKIHCLWVLHRLNQLDPKTLPEAAKEKDRSARIHAMRVLSQTADWTSGLRELALKALNDVDAGLQRAAADALGQHPTFENIKPLLTLRHQVSPADHRHSFAPRDTDGLAQPTHSRRQPDTPAKREPERIRCPRRCQRNRCSSFTRSRCILVETHSAIH
ncbi:MAG: hypothetical protein HY298_24035 [Verrucomicrobia bacterium]|nr:hypothetical protein [Verrucomicrobiota bacterium]